MNKFVMAFIFLFLAPFSWAKDCVVLLHGLARTESSMSTLQESLSDEGYKVVNQGYDSRSNTVQSLSLKTIPAALKSCGTSQKVHFVTHSMGGILVRYYLSKYVIENLGRVVMLGPPNKGSEVVDKMGELPGFYFLNGPAGLQLGTGKSSMPNSIGKADFDVGIIAGTRSINLILSTQIPDADDGKVSVESTILDGMSDHVEMPVTHTFMMRNKDVIAQVIYYLKNGEFQRNQR